MPPPAPPPARAPAPAPPPARPPARPPPPEIQICTIVAPVDGDDRPFTEPKFTLEAQITGDAAGGISWQVDGVTIGAGSPLDAVIPEPGSHEVACAVGTDGGAVIGEQITVWVLSPVAAIWHPGDGEVRDAALDVPFVGEGLDYEDGTLSGGDLVWTSDLDGQIGTGTSFNARLSAGVHTITLTATDSDGETGTDSIILTMQ